VAQCSLHFSILRVNILDGEAEDFAQFEQECNPQIDHIDSNSLKRAVLCEFTLGDVEHRRLEILNRSLLGAHSGINFLPDLLVLLMSEVHQLVELGKSVLILNLNLLNSFPVKWKL